MALRRIHADLTKGGWVRVCRADVDPGFRRATCYAMGARLRLHADLELTNAGVEKVLSELSNDTVNIKSHVPLRFQVYMYPNNNFDLRFWVWEKYFLLNLAGLRKGGTYAGNLNVAQVTIKEVYEIAKILKQMSMDDRDKDLQTICRQVIQLAKSMSIDVVRARGKAVAEEIGGLS
mmetsp:Transcript_1140/g.3526  ORF Transcript_1140/g.3526 Transcript_1140/m.3526 type:complete len:176 (-) Transcript_1140:1849-2376(-)